jgi:hypothetical protein
VITLKKFCEIAVDMFWLIFLASVGSAVAVFILQEIWGVYYV